MALRETPFHSRSAIEEYEKAQGLDGRVPGHTYGVYCTAAHSRVMTTASAITVTLAMIVSVDIVLHRQALSIKGHTLIDLNVVLMAFNWQSADADAK